MQLQADFLIVLPQYKTYFFYSNTTVDCGVGIIFHLTIFSIQNIKPTHPLLKSKIQNRIDCLRYLPIEVVCLK